MPVVQNTAGYKVAKEWLQKVDNVCATVAAPKSGVRYGSLFYDVRPCRIPASWTLVSSSSNLAVWRGVAYSLDGVASMSVTTVTASASQTPPNTGFGMAFYRGAWELLAGGAGGGGEYTAGDGITINNNVIANSGVLGVVVSTTPYNNGKLYVDSAIFKWVSNRNQSDPTAKLLTLNDGVIVHYGLVASVINSTTFELQLVSQ